MGAAPKGWAQRAAANAEPKKKKAAPKAKAKK